MTQVNSTSFTFESLRLLGAALTLQHVTSTAANIVPIPGTDRVIAIGTPAQVRALLADDVAAAPVAPAADADVHGYISKDDWQTFASGAVRGLLVWLWQEPREDRVAVLEACPVSVTAPLTRCTAGRDGECGHAQCPQLRDREPAATGRHCPLDSEGGHHD